MKMLFIGKNCKSLQLRSKFIVCIPYIPTAFHLEKKKNQKNKIKME